jgi:hypothetical protein
MPSSCGMRAQLLERGPRARAWARVLVAIAAWIVVPIAAGFRHVEHSDARRRPGSGAARRAFADSSR